MIQYDPVDIELLFVILYSIIALHHNRHIISMEIKYFKQVTLYS